MARMIDETADKQDGAHLDWLGIYGPPEPVIHYCNCEHCDYVGEAEAPEWPTLVRMEVDGIQYVTDRFLAVRADLAPVPDGYEGPVLETVIRKRTGFMAAAVIDAPVGLHEVRDATAEAMVATGWSLREIDGQDKPIAVVTATGDHIGWAMRKPSRPGGDA